MITKLYNYLKENIKFFITLIVLFIICTFELPYYINTPGGLLDVKDRVYISNSYDISGSLNLAYVTEIKATIPTLIISYFNDNWDVLKKEDVIASNETKKENDYRSKILLEESLNNSVIVGFNLAGENIEITNRKLYVTYIDENSITDLKIGDQIVSINNTKINSKEDALNEIKNSNKFNIEVINNGIKYIRSATKQNDKIGILISEIKDVKTERDVEFKFKNSESGPSGGFMMALSIYDYLTEKDLTNNLKIVGTGTIDEEGNVGEIGGVEYKIKAAVKNDTDIFFVPKDNYEEAMEVKNTNNLDIKLISISNITDAINYLENL